MENASKALLIAGGIMIAVAIISIGVMLHGAFSNASEQYVVVADTAELTKFNANFEVFRGRTNITAQEIVTLYNMAEEYKTKTYLNADVKVASSDITNIIDFLKNNSYDTSNNKIITFECASIDYHTNDGYVTKITFKKNP